MEFPVRVIPPTASPLIAQRRRSSSGLTVAAARFSLSRLEGGADTASPLAGACADAGDGGGGVGAGAGRAGASSRPLVGSGGLLQHSVLSPPLPLLHMARHLSFRCACL